MKSSLTKYVLVVLLSTPAFFQLGCMSAYKSSVGADQLDDSFERIFRTDQNTAWLSVLDALKSYRLDVSNREGGFVQTKWTDNTGEKNLTETFGDSGTYHKAQFRFKISVAKGIYHGEDAVKVSIIREQMIQRDVLEGMRRVKSDTIEENTLLYRIGRIILLRMQLSQIEDKKSQEQLENAPL